MLNNETVDVVTEERARAKSADRALQVLEYLATVPNGTTFSDIAKSLSLPKSSAHELLSVMTERSFVEFNPTTKSYRLGIRTWELGQAFVAHRDLITEARPVLSAISSNLDETVQISVLDGFEEVYLDRVDSSQPLRVQAIIGSRAPAHTTALGKVLLSDRREGDLLAGLRGRKLDAMTGNTITATDQLILELRWVRANGFAVDNEEYAVGLRCVAAPIRDHSGAVIAAASVAMPITRANADQLTDALLALVRATTDISRKLGCDAALLGAPAGAARTELRDLIEDKLQGWDATLSAIAN
jgi:IclR family KDG regulon transcriptional repressor